MFTVSTEVIGRLFADEIYDRFKKKVLLEEE